MNKFYAKFILTGFMSLIIGTTSSAMSTPSVKASIFRNSCNYYSNTSGIFLFQYEQKDARELGTDLQSVSLIYGLIGYDGSSRSQVDWQQRKEVPMKFIRPGLWEASEAITLHSRGDSKVYNHVGFVIHLTYPHGDFYDNGRQSSWGSYEVELNPLITPCVNSATNLPPYQDLPVSIHNKY